MKCFDHSKLTEPYFSPAIGPCICDDCQRLRGAPLSEPSAPSAPEPKMSRELSIAGHTERYRLNDGHMEIWYASDEQWIRQVPSKWASVDAWRDMAGRARHDLATARAIIDLFENPEATPPETAAVPELLPFTSSSKPPMFDPPGPVLSAEEAAAIVKYAKMEAYDYQQDGLDRFAASHESLRAQVEALTKERERLDFLEANVQENRTGSPSYYSADVTGGNEMDGFRIGFVLSFGVKDLTDDCRDAPHKTIRELVDVARRATPESPK